MRGLTVLRGDEELQLDEGVKQVVKSLKEGKNMILDEFQRLPDQYLDALSTALPDGTLVLLARSPEVHMRENGFSVRYDLTRQVQPFVSADC